MRLFSEVKVQNYICNKLNHAKLNWKSEIFMYLFVFVYLFIYLFTQQTLDKHKYVMKFQHWQYVMEMDGVKDVAKGTRGEKKRSKGRTDCRTGYWCRHETWDINTFLKNVYLFFCDYFCENNQFEEGSMKKKTVSSLWIWETDKLFHTVSMLSMLSKRCLLFTNWTIVCKQLFLVFSSVDCMA